MSAEGRYRNRLVLITAGQSKSHKLSAAMANRAKPQPDLSYIGSLDDLEKVYQVMWNAEIHQLKHPEGHPEHEIGREAWDLAFAQMCELTAKKFNPEDEADRDCLVALAAYEWVLTKKHGKKTYARRIRNSIAEHGIKLAISKAVLKGASSSGLKTLVEQGKVGFAFENVILKYRALFEEIDGRLIDKSEKALRP